MASSSGRQCMLVARDELDAAGPSFSWSSNSNSTSSSTNCHQQRVMGAGAHHQQPSASSSSTADDSNAGGPLSTLRRSLRQINPFKSRLFRLPATPRLSRSKKVLGRGEDFTGWNFERPSANGDSAQQQNSLMMRPLSSSSFGPSEFEFHPHQHQQPNGLLGPAGHQQQRRFSQLDGLGQFQLSPMLQRRLLAQNKSMAAEQCQCCGDKGGEQTLEGLDDLDEFLSAMESISSRGQIGGSCRVITVHQQKQQQQFRRGVGTVAGPPMAGLPGPGTKQRTRPPIPSAFNPPWTNQPPPPVANGAALKTPGQQAESFNATADINKRVEPRKEEQYYHFLPSTCYAPNGEMYAARWRPEQPPPMAQQCPQQQNGGGGVGLPGSPRLAKRAAARFSRPQPVYWPEQFGVPSQQQQPKSPSQSTITLLNTQPPVGLRSASTVSSASVDIRQQQKQSRPPLNGLFPQTQLQRRRSACSASAAVAIEEVRGCPIRGSSRDRSIAEEAEEEEAASTANYYGRDVLRLMGLEGSKQQKEANSSAENSPSLLSSPPLLFQLEDEIWPPGAAELFGVGGGEELFVGRQWLFKELCQLLVSEKVALVLLLGGPGTGKSAILRQLVLNSHFCAQKPQPSDEQHQHNTVDSGIAVSAAGGCNSSGSQLSLLNVSGHVPPESSSTGLCLPTNTQGQSRNYEWLRYLGRHVCAFHFAHLHSANSCSIVEFVRSLCAQLCQCPQLKHSYGKLIRSDSALHRLAISEAAALAVEPVELFRLLILQPIGQIYREQEEEERRRGKETASSKVDGGGGKWSSGKGSDYGSNCGSGDRMLGNSSNPAGQLPSLVLVLVDALDEAGFHRTDGGESLGWLLRRVLPDCPPQLRFLCTMASCPNGDQNAAIFGPLAEGEKPVDARRIRLDDWELDERIGRDARLFVEARVQASPALDRWVNAQFRRQSFFAAATNPDQQQQQLMGIQLAQQANFAEFSSQLVQRLRANFLALKLALAMLAEGWLLSLGALPSELGQLFALHFRHKFPSAGQFRDSLSPVLSIVLASLRPLDFDELLAALNSTEEEGPSRVSGQELRSRLAQLAPLVVQLPVSGHFVPVHSSFRDWLVKEGPAEFAIDIRHGHILLALSLVRSARQQCARVSQEQLFELAHHLLKANPHKYMRQELASRLNMPLGKDAQVQWLQMGAEGQGGGMLANGLLCRRNIFYPNSKVSRLLLLAGADPNSSRWPDGAEEPVLSAFSRAGNSEMVQLLLQFGADPNSGQPSPPLFLAVQHGHESVARLLCANGADLCAKDAEGRGLLWHAAAKDSLAMLGFLLDAIGEAARGEHQLKKEELLEATKATVSGDHRRYSACSSSGYEESGQQRMMSSRQHQQQQNGHTNGHRPDRTEAIREAFEVAAERGSVRVCRFLLDCTDAVLDTSRAMCIACANGRSEVVQFLLSRGASLASEQTWNGKSALLCAVESGSWDLVVSVLNGTGPSAAQHELNAMSGPDRLSPLMVAARHGHVGLVDLLINRGAHLEAVDVHGRTATMHAIEAGHGSTVGLLLERGCSLRARDGHGNTLLHLLARHPSKCLINRLLEAGLSLEDKNREDLRPIEVAIQCGQLLAIDTFLRRGARLRSLTWQIALASHPPLTLVLLRKLLDDAQILLRRKRPTEAQHRFSYALQKCDWLLMLSRGDQQQVPERNEALLPIRAQLTQFKVQALHSMAALKRRANVIGEAIQLATEALDLLDSGEMALEDGHPCSGTSPPASSEEEEESSSSNSPREEDQQHHRQQQHREQRFELHLLMAKCHFDARDLDRARVDAQLAACLQPGDQEAQSLLAVLSAG